jgi:FkbM family methyltransferase
MSSTVDAPPLYHQFPLKIKQCRHGKMLYLETDKYIGGSFDLYGEYCEEECRIFQQVIHPGEVVIDAGANMGAHTVLFSKLVGAGGYVHSFEPQRTLCNILSANLALNGIRNVEAHQRCVGSGPAVADIAELDYTAFDNFGGLAANMPGGDRYAKVPVVSIDAFDLARCDFIKIDVEGMEMEAIEGARTTIEKFQPVLYVEDDRPQNRTGLVELLKSLDFRIFRHRAMYYNNDNFFGNENNVFGYEHAINLVCLPPRHHGVNVMGFVEV